MRFTRKAELQFFTLKNIQNDFPRKISFFKAIITKFFLYITCNLQAFQILNVDAINFIGSPVENGDPSKNVLLKKNIVNNFFKALETKWAVTKTDSRGLVEFLN